MAGLAEILDENRRLREQLAQTNGVLKEKNEALQEKDQQLAAKDQTIEAQRIELDKREAMIEVVKARAEQLAQQLDFLTRKASGPASQRFIPETQQILPFPGDIEPPPRAPVPDDEDTDEEKAKGRRKRGGKKPRRRKREDFSHFEDRQVRCKVDPDARCAGCGGVLSVIGQAHSFRVEWVPGHFLIDDVVRDKCSCPKCPGQGVLTVPGPYALQRALCGNSLLARVLVDKYCDHLPLHRQARRMKREGFEVGTNTLSGWVKQAAALLEPVARAVRAALLGGAYLQGDDTGFPVQDGGNGRLRKGRLWAFTDQEQAFYAFTATKEGEYPAKLLSAFTGELLLVDGGSEFNRVVRELKLERAGCWSHLRKYFFEARHYHPAEVTLALGTIRDLFLIERSLAGQEAAAIRAERQARSKPLVDGFFAWVKALSSRVRPKSKLGEAVGYALNQESSLRVYLEHGELPMHNNLSELLLRQGVVGRKNWLFARSEGGAKAAATLYTLVGSCQLQGIDPQGYLVDILTHLPDHPINRVSELTPMNWRLDKERHTAAAG